MTSNLFECSVNEKHMHEKLIFLYHICSQIIMKAARKCYNLLMFKFQLEVNRSRKVLARERAEVKDFIFPRKTE